MADDETQAANDAIRAEAAKKTDAAPEVKVEVQKQATPAPDDLEQIAAKADNPDAVRKAIKAEREAAKVERQRAEGLAAQVKEYEDRDKSDQEKLEERATGAETRAVKAEGDLERFMVAYEKGLPFELAARLQGADKKELEEDADRLLKLVKVNGKPAGDIDAGTGEGGAGNSLNDLIRAQSAR